VNHSNDNQHLACSECFEDQGLRLDALRLGEPSDERCPRCGRTQGRKLPKRALEHLAHRFFIWGSLHKCDYGAAPVIQFNEHQKTSITPSPWLVNDVKLLEECLSVGFFHYGPRMWMVGEIGPLSDLQNDQTQPGIIKRILTEYPSRNVEPSKELYRVRKDPKHPDSSEEYDSPPRPAPSHGRLDSEDVSVLYASEDLDVCVHECRIAAEDDVYVATLRPTRSLKMLDLTILLKEENVTEFDSLDLAVHMLFLAGAHSYPISRNLSAAAKVAGFDGIIYPSYFSLLRLGIMPFQTTYGISNRRIPQYQQIEESTAIPNAAIFGRPIFEETLMVKCINRLVLSQVAYDFRFGPVQN
jgi:hypothetical protein